MSRHPTRLKWLSVIALIVGAGVVTAWGYRQITAGGIGALIGAAAVPVVVPAVALALSAGAIWRATTILGNDGTPRESPTMV